MLNSIRGSLCIYGTTEVLLSSITTTLSKNNYYFEKHLWCLIARTISDSIFYVSVGTYSLSEQSRKKRLNHVALIALDAGRENMSLACVQTFPLFLLLHR